MFAWADDYLNFCLILSAQTAFLVFYICFLAYSSVSGSARDALPLITTCNQIVSEFLDYGSRLLRLNGFFVGRDDNSCWEERNN